jgi:hypothetical protein
VPEVQVPRIVEMKYDQAQKEVAGLGLKLRLAGEEYSPVYPAGVIVNQAPTPDKRIAVGGTIDVFVSKGPELALVPRVVGIPFADAKTQLEGVGFRVKQADRFHEQVPAGIVLEQQPGALEQAPRGSEVTLAVSRGPQPTPTATATPKPTVTPTPRPPTATPRPPPTPTTVPEPTVSQSDVPASGDTLKHQLKANEIAMVAGPRITYGEFTCPSAQSQICVLLVRVTKPTELTVTGLATASNWLGVWAGATADGVLARETVYLWRPPNCGNGCDSALVGIFEDGRLLETRPLSK